jgi:hypothetical protein
MRRKAKPRNLKFEHLEIRRPLTADYQPTCFFSPEDVYFCPYLSLKEITIDGGVPISDQPIKTGNTVLAYDRDLLSPDRSQQAKSISDTWEQDSFATPGMIFTLTFEQVGPFSTGDIPTASIREDYPTGILVTSELLDSAGREVHRKLDFFPVESEQIPVALPSSQCQGGGGCFSVPSYQREFSIPPVGKVGNYVLKMNVSLVQPGMAPSQATQLKSELEFTQYVIGGIPLPDSILAAAGFDQFEERVIRKAAEFADGAGDEDDILQRLLPSIYALGWEYSPEQKTDPINGLIRLYVNSSEYVHCREFFFTLRHLAFMHGIPLEDRYVEYKNANFLTIRGLRPPVMQQTGNAANVITGIKDRWLFSNHWLGFYNGKYYDPTFNRIETSDDYAVYTKIRRSSSNGFQFAENENVEVDISRKLYRDISDPFFLPEDGAQNFSSLDDQPGDSASPIVSEVQVLQDPDRTSWLLDILITIPPARTYDTIRPNLVSGDQVNAIYLDSARVTPYVMQLLPSNGDEERLRFSVPINSIDIKNNLPLSLTLATSTKALGGESISSNFPIDDSVRDAIVAHSQRGKATIQTQSHTNEDQTKTSLQIDITGAANKSISIVVQSDSGASLWSSTFKSLTDLLRFEVPFSQVRRVGTHVNAIYASFFTDELEFIEFQVIPVSPISFASMTPYPLGYESMDVTLEPAVNNEGEIDRLELRHDRVTSPYSRKIAVFSDARGKHYTYLVEGGDVSNQAWFIPSERMAADRPTGALRLVRLIGTHVASGESDSFVPASETFLAAEAIANLAGRMAGPWVNASNRFNVDNDPDNKVTAADALAVINVLARQSRGVLEGYSFFERGSTLRFPDVNDDFYLTPLDALLVINQMSRSRLPGAIEISNSSVVENLPAGTVVGSFSPTDAVSNVTHNYRMVTGSGDADNGLFSIDGSGVLLTAASFNFEAKKAYSIRVRSVDSTGRVNERAFSIAITNVNEAPTALSLTSTLIANNANIGTLVGSFTSADPEPSDTFTYALASGAGDTDNSLFAIGNTGQLLTTFVTNHATKSSYKIRVRVVDNEGLAFEQAITISVASVNAAPTAIFLSNSSVAENLPAGTVVGSLGSTDVNASDTHSYALVVGSGDTDNASFAINSNGVLSTAASFNFEAKNSYSIRVRSTDGGGLFTEQFLTIAITNVNEAPTLLALSNSSVANGAGSGTLVGNLSTTDPDEGSTFTYAIVSGAGDTDNSLFRIIDNKMTIAFAASSATKSSYTVRVRSTDLGNLSAEQPFTILLGVRPISTLFPGETYAAGSDFINSEPKLVDLNHDGLLDFIASGTSGASGSVVAEITAVLGLGDGRFAEQQTSSTGVVLRNLRVVDLNGDSFADVIASSGEDVYTLMGNGDGTFLPPRLVASLPNLQGITVADINNDRSPDLIVNYRLGDHFGVFLGAGDGIFSSETRISLEDPSLIVFSVFIEDLDSDGSLDLIASTSDSTGENVSVTALLGNGDGTFNPTPLQTSGIKSTRLGIADLNGDDIPDLYAQFSAQPSIAPNDVAVYFGKGDGKFSEARLLGLSKDFVSIASEDINGDAIDDLVIGIAGYTNGAAIVLGNANQDLVVDQEILFETPPSWLFVKDLNNDRELDLIVADSRTAIISVHLGSSTSGWFDQLEQFKISANINSSPKSPTVSDLNQDGISDLIFIVDDPRRANLANDVAVSLGQGDGKFREPSYYSVGVRPSAIISSDLNGDGITDLAITNEGSSNISILLGNGNGTFLTHSRLPAVNPELIKSGDVNNDGVIDLIVSRFRGDELFIYFGIGNGNFSEHLKIDATPGFAFNAIILDDLNSDGLPDVALVHRYLNKLSVLFGAGDGTFSIQPQTLETGDNPSDAIAEDVTGDGALDLIVLNNTSDDISIFPGVGDGTFGEPKRFTTGRLSFPVSIVGRDLNVDGFLDLVTANRTANTVSVLLGSGDGKFGVPQYFAGSQNMLWVGVGSFDGDETPDLITADSSFSSEFVFFNVYLGRRAN